MSRWTALFAAAALACGTPEPSPAPEPVAEPAADEVPPMPVPPAPNTAPGVDFGAMPAGPMTSPVHIVMTVRGMEVAPAGEVHEGKGHHHILIDTEPLPAGTVIPSDAQHIHFGAGQTVADVELTPGEHTLTLQFADGMHQSYGPEWSKTTTVNVVAPAH